MIKVHQHLVARVFSKNFLRDVEKDALTILENQGLFVDEDVKQIREEVMPTIYDEVFRTVQRMEAIDRFVNSRYFRLIRNY